ncbi:unnamed protein product [Penicillium bialowiezense]
MGIRDKLKSKLMSSERRNSSKIDIAADPYTTRQRGSTSEVQATLSRDGRYGTTDQTTRIAEEKEHVKLAQDSDVTKAKNWDLKVLVEPSEQENIIDIVAVHGIGADPSDTWAHRETWVDWLQNKEMLPKIFPNARIMRFDYDSKWFGGFDEPHTETCVRHVSSQLVKSLQTLRKDLARPLIFIAHSFGGFPVMHALRYSHDKPNEWGNSFQFTAGLAFFGVPFRGRQGLPIEELVRLIRDFKITKDPNFQIWANAMSTSVAESQYLTETVLHYLKTRGDRPVPITCFFETEPSPVGRFFDKPHKEYVVPEGSACVDPSDGVARAALARHHYNLQKFSGPEDSQWKNIVVPQMKSLAQNASAFFKNTPTLNDDQIFVFKNLRTMEDAEFDSHANESIATCDERTRQELLDTISQWTDSPMDCEHIYWLEGKAGTGKSTIARTVADRLYEKGLLAASFFFKRDEADRRSAKYFFTTIAVQLVRIMPAVAAHMRSAIEANPGIA